LDWRLSLEHRKRLPGNSGTAESGLSLLPGSGDGRVGTSGSERDSEYGPRRKIGRYPGSKTRCASAAAATPAAAASKPPCPPARRRHAPSNGCRGQWAPPAHWSFGYGAWALHKDGGKTVPAPSSAGQEILRRVRLESPWSWRSHRGRRAPCHGSDLGVADSFDSPPPVSVSATDVTLTVRF